MQAGEEESTIGCFTVRIRVAHPDRPHDFRELELLVDTGATFTKLPEDLLLELGIKPTATKTTLLANSQTMRRPSGHALVTIHGISDLVPVVFGPRGQMTFIGATTLEILGFMVHPIAQTLIPRASLEPSEF